MNEEINSVPAFTVRSVAISLLCIVLSTLFIQFGSMVEGSFDYLDQTAFAFPALWLIFLLLGLSVGLFSLLRFRFLSRQELIFILCATLVAAPLSGRGFWKLMLATTSTIPRTLDLDRLDVFPDKLWPHGVNLMEGIFEESGALDASILEFHGGGQWEVISTEKFGDIRVPVLKNGSPEDRSWLRLRMPIQKNNVPFIYREQPYLFDILVRARNLGPDSSTYGRVFFDDSEIFVEEFFNMREQEKVTFVQKEGFIRAGFYGFSVPNRVKKYLIFEIGLEGNGEVTFADPNFRNVFAIEAAYRGRQAVSASSWQKMTEEDRNRYVRVPDNRLSWDGLVYLLLGNIPWKDWIDPALAWGSFVFMIGLGSFGIVVIMRKQWVDSERYPLPLARITEIFLGHDDPTNGYSSPPIWRNRIMWAGFGVSFFWCLMKLWLLFNPDIPDLNIMVSLQPYIENPRFGKMWHGVFFGVNALFLSLCVFLELNVLGSLVVGFFLFRSQLWFGESSGLSEVRGFPFRDEQVLIGYLVYAFIILFFTRKYIWQAFSSLFSGKGKREDILHYRLGFLLLIVCIMGIAAWSWWVELPVHSMLAIYLILLLIAFVAAKVRAECGAPHGDYFIVSTVVALTVFGGMRFYDASPFIFMTFLSISVTGFVFFIIPGIQLEFLQISRHYRIKTGHIFASILLGLLGGIIIGGRGYLDTLYSRGADNFIAQGDFKSQRASLKYYGIELGEMNSRLTDEILGEDNPSTRSPGSSSKGWESQSWVLIFTGLGTTAVTVARQMFAGFWFHPVGFILGPTRMLELIWGSALVAFAIRWFILKMGGARSVREKLLPCFIGVLLASILTQALFFTISTILYIYFPGSGFEGLNFSTFQKIF